MNRSSEKQKRSGFTLVEILFVLALMVMIATVVIGNFDAIFSGNKEKVAEIFVNNTLESSLAAYKVHIGNYPKTEEMKSFSALMVAPSGKEKKWKGPYMKKKVQDPWGNEYQYRFPGMKNPKSYDIWSRGEDGVDSEDDIGNWE